ncbi:MULTISPECIES: hypothetical protein, partial [Streptomyces]|uniref:hypothetical protein n=1 Tax=Streptomyces lycopersici TaxID=2974589 RepID=UPI0021CF292F
AENGGHEHAGRLHGFSQNSEWHECSKGFRSAFPAVPFLLFQDGGRPSRNPPPELFIKLLGTKAGGGRKTRGAAIDDNPDGCEGVAMRCSARGMVAMFRPERRPR